MPSTYHSLSYHIVFSTKHRATTIALPWRGRLNEYLGGTIRGLEGVSLGVGGVADHIHLLASLKPTHCLADVVREIKKASSVWVHQEIGVREFAWQDGYAAFTVSPTSRNAIQKYIAMQEEHHRKRSFRDELIAMLKRAGVEYDPRNLD
jgi:putative transposase